MGPTLGLSTQETGSQCILAQWKFWAYQLGCRNLPSNGKSEAPSRQPAPAARWGCIAPTYFAMGNRALGDSFRQTCNSEDDCLYEMRPSVRQLKLKLANTKATPLAFDRNTIG